MIDRWCESCHRWTSARYCPICGHYTTQHIIGNFIVSVTISPVFDNRLINLDRVVYLDFRRLGVVRAITEKGFLNGRPSIIIIDVEIPKHDWCESAIEVAVQEGKIVCVGVDNDGINLKYKEA